MALTIDSFYASSLLVIYDGDAETQAAYRDQVFAEIGAVVRGAESTASTTTTAEAVPTSPSSNPQRSKPRRPAGQAIIRLIDFAHCVAAGSTDLQTATYPPTHPDLPDTGFLLGLRSLCAALEWLWTEDRERRAADPDPAVVQLPALRVSGRSVFDRVLPGSIIEEAADHGAL